MNRHPIVITLIICALLTGGMSLEPERALAGGRLPQQQSLARKIIKGVFTIGTTAILLFSNPLQIKQNDLPVMTQTDPFREAVLELNPTSLTQVLQQTTEQQININKQLFSDGSTALHYAVMDGHFRDERSKLQVVDILMAHGANPYLKNNHGVSAYDKVYNQLYDSQANIALAAILTRYVHGISATDEAGISPIEYAIKYATKSKSLWLARELANAGADIGILQDSMYVSSKLKYIANQHSELKILEDAAMLLTDAEQFLAAIDQVGDRAKIFKRIGNYLFAIATNHDNFTAAEALIKLGAIDPNEHPYRIQDSIIRIAQLSPSETSELDYIAWLLNVGADPNQNSSKANSINMLHRAAWDGDVATVKLLLANGADPTLACSLKGKTALHYALTGGNHDEYPVEVFTIVNTLLAHNAATNSEAKRLTEIRDYDGLRPYEVMLQQIDDNFTPYSLRSHVIINAATAAILHRNTEHHEQPEHTALHWADLSGLERIKTLIKQDNSYLSGAELDSFATYLHEQIPNWNASLYTQ